MIYLLLSIIIFNLIAYLIPKVMTRLEMYVVSLFTIVFDLVVDMFLDLKYNLYGYFHKGFEPEALLAICGVFPAVNIIILNYFPYQKGLKNQMYYILASTLFLLAYEWGAVNWGYFYYTKWKLWYSALSYPVILATLAWQLYWLRKVISSQYDKRG